MVLSFFFFGYLSTQIAGIYIANKYEGVYLFFNIMNKLIIYSHVRFINDGCICLFIINTIMFKIFMVIVFIIYIKELF